VPLSSLWLGKEDTAMARIEERRTRRRGGRAWSPLVVILAMMSEAPLRAANITVTTLADEEVVDGDCSLREAIAAANADASSGDCAAGTGRDDRIVVAVAGTILLAADLPVVEEGVAIVGPGAEALTIDGAESFRLLELDPPFVPTTWILISGLTLTRGLADQGGAIHAVAGHVVLRDLRIVDNAASTEGGGAFVNAPATLLVERSTIAGNVVIGAFGGGGISARGSVTLRASTLADNSALHPTGDGGGIQFVQGVLESRLVLRDSTLSGNHASGVGGGVNVVSLVPDSLLEVVLDSTTLTGNTAGGGGGVRLSASFGGLVSLTLANSVVAANVDLSLGSTIFPDLLLASSPELTVLSQGFNLVGDHSGGEDYFPAGMPNASGDFVGTEAAPLDPRLDVLGDYGGPTPTHHPLQENPHPLIDQGSCPTAVRDQRGHGDAGTGLRAHDVAVPDNPAGDGCDIGSVEAGAADLSDPLIFADGFESANLLFWSTDVP
jgi:CSLREA domain-containing protein